MRFGHGGLTAGTSFTEPSLLNQLLETINAGRLAEAWEMRQGLHTLIGDKYGLVEPLVEAIESSVMRGAVRRGRNIPWDPVRLLFAEAVLLRNLQHKPIASREVLAKIDRIMPCFVSDSGYRATIAEMRPIVDTWSALPIG